MPLKIQLRPKERVIINGAVIEGQDSGRTEIVVLNHVSIMRQKHILTEEKANTPCKRLYFTIQMQYIDTDNAEDYKPDFERYWKDLKDNLTLEPIVAALDNIKVLVADERYYDALKVCRDLIKAETELLKIELDEETTALISEEKTDQK